MYILIIIQFVVWGRLPASLCFLIFLLPFFIFAISYSAKAPAGNALPAKLYIRPRRQLKMPRRRKS